MSSPLQNRVDPFGEILAVPDRGALFGNRGGRIHLDGKRLGRRRWASRRWICCVLAFKNRRREVMGRGYTELFFLDEPTALAAGHRPCFECRRAEALAFAEAFSRAHGLAKRASADEMDAILHPQRLGPRDRAEAGALPDFALFAEGDTAFMKLGESALPWSFQGFGEARPLPGGEVEALTLAAIRKTLAAGYLPRKPEIAERPRA